MVEFILHICLTSEKEKEDILKTLRPRADCFVQNGAIENNMKLFENKELLSETTDYQSFEVDMLEVTNLPTDANDILNTTIPMKISLKKHWIPKVDDAFVRDEKIRPAMRAYF